MEGRLEISYNGMWGTVCVDGWHILDAVVVCRQLRFGPPKVTKHFFGSGAGGPVLISFASCFGFEERLLDCPTQSASRMTECLHNSDVGVVCNAPVGMHLFNLFYFLFVWHTNLRSGIPFTEVSKSNSFV